MQFILSDDLSRHKHINFLAFFAFYKNHKNINKKQCDKNDQTINHSDNPMSFDAIITLFDNHSTCSFVTTFLSSTLE